MCVKNSTHSKIWHDMSNSLVYDAAGPACNQAASWTSYELRAGILSSWELGILSIYELASCENLTKIVKFFWRKLPSVELHAYKFLRTSWNISKIWNCMSNFEIHFENLTPAKKLWYNRIRKKKQSALEIWQKKSNFQAAVFYERWMYGQGLMTAIIRLRAYTFLRGIKLYVCNRNGGCHI